MITECVHQFIAPEIEKQLIRDQLKQRQSKHIAVAHELVFSTMTDLQKFGFTGESCSNEHNKMKFYTRYFSLTLMYF